ncbi:MAG: prolipoprotein diacylglyceryl transferase [Chloroflexota bacterium]
MSFDIGPLTIHLYGIILMAGVIAAAFLADNEAKRREKDPEFLWDSLIWLVIGGVIGARLWHILTPSVSAGTSASYYFSHPIEALSIWKGGLGIPGAVIGGGVALYIVSTMKKQNFLVWADIIIPGVALGQAIGRWGNFANQELYGKATDLPWAIFIAPENRIPLGSTVEYYHPLFLYESLLSLANVMFLLWLGRKFLDKLKPGDIFLSYLITYPIVRFGLEYLRLDISEVAGLNINQTVMGAVVIISTSMLIYRHKFAATQTHTVRERRKSQKG